MIKKNLPGVTTLFFGFGSTGCNALIGERHPIPSGNYKVPWTQQLHRGADNFANDAPKQSTIERIRQRVSYNWEE